MPALEHRAPDRIVSTREARAILSIGKTTEHVYRRTQPDFPVRLQLGPGRFGYKLSDLTRWIDTRPAAPTAPAPERAAAARRAKRAATTTSAAPATPEAASA